MMQLTLFAPDITCDHCIATIARTVDGHPGARFLTGDVEGRRFALEIESGGVLDALTAALEAGGYPLGPADLSLTSRAIQSSDGSWTPSHRVKATDAGAEINYDCPCSCVAGFAFNRAVAVAEPESCCCGRSMLVGRGAEERLRARIESSAYRFDVQTLTMPWGQPLEVALAIPAEPAH